MHGRCAGGMYTRHVHTAGRAGRCRFKDRRTDGSTALPALSTALPVVSPCRWQPRPWCRPCQHGLKQASRQCIRHSSEQPDAASITTAPCNSSPNNRWPTGGLHYVLQCITQQLKRVFSQQTNAKKTSARPYKSINCFVFGVRGNVRGPTVFSLPSAVAALEDMARASLAFNAGVEERHHEIASCSECACSWDHYCTEQWQQGSRHGA